MCDASGITGPDTNGPLKSTRVSRLNPSKSSAYSTPARALVSFRYAYFLPSMNILYKLYDFYVYYASYTSYAYHVAIVQFLQHVHRRKKIFTPER